MQITDYIPTVGTLRNVLDIALVFIIVYVVLKLLRGTRAVPTVVGMVIIGLLYWLAVAQELTTLEAVLRSAVPYIGFVVIILFASEIRQALIYFGNRLRFPILRQERWRPVVDVVAAKLLTPYGLRTLASDHPDYKATYAGDLRARDAAYHQGTVWPWLIGHFIDARLKVDGDKAGARSLLRAFDHHLQDAGIGTISEIFDAEPPFHARGCIAQAWSVAEVLRAYVNTNDDTQA